MIAKSISNRKFFTIFERILLIRDKIGFITILRFLSVFKKEIVFAGACGHLCPQLFKVLPTFFFFNSSNLTTNLTKTHPEFQIIGLARYDFGVEAKRKVQ